MQMKRCIEIIAYNDANEIVYRHTFTNYQWYEDDKPIIDSYNERVRLNVRKIEGKRYDAEGELTEHWLLVYTDIGSPSEGTTIAKGIATHEYYPESGLEPIACLPPIG